MEQKTKKTLAYTAVGVATAAVLLQAGRKVYQEVQQQKAAKSEALRLQAEQAIEDNKAVKPSAE